MKLCMFTPLELDLERGWPGKVDGADVIQLAAQTLQAFFAGGGTAREHARFPLARVRLRPPVLHPPSIRVFDGGDFWFANPASVHGPDEEIPLPDGAEALAAELRPAAIVGGDERIGGFTNAITWVAEGLEGTKARDFSFSLGAFVVTPDEQTPVGVDWESLLDHARRNTRLVPGDVIAAGAVELTRASPGDIVELELNGLGPLRNQIA